MPEHPSLIVLLPARADPFGEAPPGDLGGSSGDGCHVPGDLGGHFSVIRGESHDDARLPFHDLEV